MLKNIYEILCKSVGYRPSAMINTSKIGFSLKESLKETNMIVQGVDLMDLYNDLQQKIKELIKSKQQKKQFLSRKKIFCKKRLFQLNTIFFDFHKNQNLA